MIPYAASFIFGIAAFHALPLYPFSIVASWTAATVFLSLKRRDKLFIPLIIALGFFYSSLRHDVLPELRLPDRAVLVEGTVVEVPEESYGKVRFIIDRVRIERQDIRGKVRLSAPPDMPDAIGQEGAYGMPGKVDAGTVVKEPSFGDRISATAKLREPTVLRNPGVYAYDAKKYGIVAAGYSKDMTVTGRGSGLLVWLYGKRQALAATIDHSLSEESASFHRAIITGLQRGIRPEMRDAFSATGLAHLLSISGTHFGLLAFMTFGVFRKIARLMPAPILAKITVHVSPSQVAAVLTVPVLVLYAFISGASIPAVRSFVMVFIYLCALFLGRKGQWLNSLSIAAAVILLWDPDSLFDLSFQLSFVAVLSIGYALEKRPVSGAQHAVRSGDSVNEEGKGPLKKASGWIRSSILITAAAVLGTAPLVAAVFKQFSLISPLANFVVTPFVCLFILPLGFLAALAALLLDLPALPLGGMIDAITHLSLRLVKAFSDIPFASVRIHTPSWFMVVLYFSSLLFLMKSIRKWRPLPLVLVILVYCVSPYVTRDNRTKITFLDVGQGDSAVLELPDKKIMLIDGGTREPDTGRSVVAPYLWSEGFSTIDYLVLSHAHPDHYGGLIYVLDNFNIGEFWFNGRVFSWTEDLFKRIKRRNIPVRILERGDALDAGAYAVYLLHPHGKRTAPPEEQFFNQNNESLVLRMKAGTTSVLFTGDISGEAESDLVQLDRKWLKSDIIKVPHHGGRTSSSGDLINAVSPETAVVSVGKNNAYNHPHPETLQRYRDAGATLFRTDRDGAVTVYLNDAPGRPYDVKTFWDRTPKKVRTVVDEVDNLRLLF